MKASGWWLAGTAGALFGCSPEMGTTGPNVTRSFDTPHMLYAPRRLFSMARRSIATMTAFQILMFCVA
jgi:hypothetical protein